MGVLAATSLEISFNRTFWRSVHNLDGTEVRRVIKAIDLFVDDPDHPSLNLHPVQGNSKRRLHTFRASNDIRVLLAREGSVFILIEAGHHDAVYERAERSWFVINPTSRSIRLVSADATPEETHVANYTAESSRLFDHWGHSDLADAGFDEATIDALRSCETEDDLLAL